MWNSKNLLDRQNDPWAPENIDRNSIQYPTLQSNLPSQYPDNSYTQYGNNGNNPQTAFIPPQRIDIVIEKPNTAHKEERRNDGWGNQIKKNNDYNMPIPFGYNDEVNKRNNIKQVEPINKNEIRQKQKIFENNGNNGWGDNSNNNGWGNDNNNGWGNNNNNTNNVNINNNGWGDNNGWGNQGNNKNPINLFNILGQEKTKQPVNLWSSKFASVLKRNIQLSTFQIKRKIDYQGNDVNWVEDQRKRHQSTFFNAGVGRLQDYLNQQVILLEASPHQKKLNQLKKRGQVFRDDDFPPNQQSLTGQWGYVKSWKDITWRKISSFIQNPVVFDKKVIPESIKQGILGDCYLLAGLAALAQSPQRIFNLFLTTEQNHQKYYAVKILYKGMWKTIDVDQYVPVLNNKPAFSKAIGPELWVVILQKAWAKLYGSYKNIEAGYPQQGLHDLTGAHVHMLRLQKKDFDPQHAWKYLMSASRKKFSMIASSQPGSDSNQLFSGVVLGHAYTIMAVYQIQANGKLQRLVKIRNPWGRTQTKGPFSDNDPVWKTISKQQKHRLGYSNNQHDGICFQTWRDFLRDFRTITTAQVSDTASYVYYTQQTSPYKGCYFRVKIFKDGQYSLQINQTPDRMFSKDIQKNFKYLPATLLIGRIDANKVRHYEGSQQPYRTIYKKHLLKAGDYVVFGKIYYNKHQTDYSVTLSIYGESACLIQPCSANYCPNFKQRLYMDRAKHTSPKQLKSGIFYNQQIMTEGYIYCAMWNRSNRPGKFLIKVQPNHNPAVRLKKPYKNQNDIKIVIEPGKQQIILARVPDFTNPTGGIGSVQFVG